MGAFIFLETNLQVKGMTEAFRDKVRKIKDGYDEEEIFKVKGDEIFLPDQVESCDPYEAYVETPLKALVQVAEEDGFKVNGSVFLTSDWSDFDNIMVIVEDNEISCENTEIRNAGDDELIRELKRRGYEIGKTKEYPVITLYSFDDTVIVKMFSTEEEAAQAIKAEFDEEVRIDTEENGHVIGEDMETDCDKEYGKNGYCWATITNYRKTGEKDIIKWMIGTLGSEGTDGQAKRNIENNSYEWWQENVMDERLAGCDSCEKEELYLHWLNEQKTNHVSNDVFETQANTLFNEYDEAFSVLAKQ